MMKSLSEFMAATDNKPWTSFRDALNQATRDAYCLPGAPQPHPPARLNNLPKPGKLLKN